jgi:hypothetical protein
MSKTYNTGEIIALLKPGKIAKDLSGYYHDITMDEKERIYHVGRNEDKGTAELTTRFMQAKWQLLPRYVTREEAIKAYEEGKTIRVEWESGWNEYREGKWEHVSWKELTNGKWSIVEDDGEE